MNFQLKLDRNKHEAIRMVKIGEFNFSKGKENNFFQFGESRTECSNAVVQNYENSNVQRKKPPDCERGVTTSSMVELSMTMEDIVQLIEQESDAELRTEVLLSSVEAMVDDYSGNNGICC
ncbi:hypothetical protein ES288_D09G089500v1 [Gossypium darwinii]|uniref:Uncharacterized protein n=1 Tax=Gossypium darwinii TaxID=34276 RepID=A0A5D2B9I2_GOSDA|nr:hypothetical protein ES288_D09G089500v1 [Gossypium darwinii]